MTPDAEGARRRLESASPAPPDAPPGAEGPGGDSIAAAAAVDALRSLADSLRRVDTAAAAADWDGGSALASVIAGAQAELTSVRETVTSDIAAVGASQLWLARAEDYARGVELTRDVAPPPTQAWANAAVAVGLAK